MTQGADVEGEGLTLLGDVAWCGVVVPGDRSRALLAALALRGGRSVPDARLVAEVWGDETPANPAKALQVLVSRTRSQTAAEVISRNGDGYALGVRLVDALLIKEYADEAAAALATGDVRGAIAAARAADLPVASAGEDDGPLADLRDQARRDHARAQAVLAKALAASGDYVEALPLLEAQVEASPDNEALVESLLRAEANVRGTAAALARFETHRERLRDDTGSDPGPALQRLHQDLLARDRPVRSGLRFAPTRLIGRDDDLAELAASLATSRVTSIVGAGGLGKTTLAHELGHRAEQPVVHFVELAGVTSEDGVLPEIASALSVRDSVSLRTQTPAMRADLRGRVVEQLDSAPTLLILDNCEQVVGAVADLVAVLVAHARDLRVVTTSRSPLNIAAEKVHLLGALDPAAGLELFRERATAARPDARLDEDVTAALVARLDGLPLAIELAAAKVRVMSVSEIHRRLENRFALLDGGVRGAPDRHRTLRAVIDWSWNLLEVDNQAALRRLAVFPDGFSLDGAEAVIGEHDALDLITDLVEQSLVNVQEGTTVRYRMLETVREFGRQELERAGEVDVATKAVDEWALRLCLSIVGNLFTPAQYETVDRIRPEEGNLAAVLRHALEARDRDVVAAVMATLGAYWTISGSHLQAIAVAARVEDVLQDHDPPAYLLDATRWALCACLYHGMAISSSVDESSVTAVRRLGIETTDQMLRANLVVILAFADHTPGEWQSVVAGLAESDDVYVARLALTWCSHSYENSGDLASALRAAERGIELCDDLDGPWTRAALHGQVASLEIQVGRVSEARAHALQAIGPLQRLGAVDGQLVLSVLAMCDIVNGHLDRAEETLQSMESAADMWGGWPMGLVTGSARAELALARGDIDEGLAHYAESVRSLWEWRIPGVSSTPAFEPWLLYPEAAQLAAYVVHGRTASARMLCSDLAVKLLPVLRGELPEEAGSSDPVDYPISGSVLFAIALWHLDDGMDPERLVPLLAIALRFGYNRTYPSLAWSHAVDRVDGDLLERAVAAVADVDRDELRHQAIVLVAELG